MKLSVSYPGLLALLVIGLPLSSGCKDSSSRGFAAPTATQDTMTPDPTTPPATPLGDVMGTVFVDVDRNGALDMGEPGLPGVTVDLSDLDDQPLGSAVTDSDGIYSFAGLAEGSYRVSIVGTSSEINTILFDDFDATTPTSADVAVTGGGVSEASFGFAMKMPDDPTDPPDLVLEFDCDDPDGNGIVISTNTQPLGFWKDEVKAALDGQPSPSGQFDAAALLALLDQVRNLLLADPFALTAGNELQEAFDIMQNETPVMPDILLKQLMPAELNRLAGFGTTDPQFEGLELSLLEYAEVAVNVLDPDADRPQLEEIKDLLEAYNLSGTIFCPDHNP